MKTAYINGIIIDGSLDMEIVSGKVIIVEDKKIADIISDDDFAGMDKNNINIVDLSGRYILPGLINLHAHLAGTGKPAKKQMDLNKISRIVASNALTKKVGCAIVAKNAKDGLMGGVTTIRSVGGIADTDSMVRDKINKGKLVGPRILTSNCAISVPGGHMAGSFAYEAHSAKEAADFVDVIAKDNPDLIKLMITGGVMDADEVGEPGVLRMPADYVKAACDRAHELGFVVAAHTEGVEGVKVALKNGVDTIEHGAKPDEEMMQLFKERGVCQVMTLTPAIPYVLRLPGMFNLSDAAAKNSDIVVNGMVELAKECLKEGITVGLGTDSGCTYATQYGFWREMQHFVDRCGVSNSFALHTGTLVNARIVGIDDITGSIEVGKMADMIVVSKNPLENLRALDNVEMVVFEGKCYDHPKLEKYKEVEDVLNAV